MSFGFPNGLSTECHFPQGPSDNHCLITLTIFAGFEDLYLMTRQLDFRPCAPYLGAAADGYGLDRHIRRVWFSPVTGAAHYCAVDMHFSGLLGPFGLHVVRFS